VGQYDTINHIDDAGFVDGQFWWLEQNYQDRVYDDRSIMHWGSSAKDFGSDDELLLVQLAMWKKRGLDFQPPGWYTKNDLEYSKWAMQPTRKDVDGLKKVYPSKKEGSK
jgi:hypothetical protein